MEHSKLKKNMKVFENLRLHSVKDSEICNLVPNTYGLGAYYYCFLLEKPYKWYKRPYEWYKATVGCAAYLFKKKKILSCYETN